MDEYKSIEHSIREHADRKLITRFTHWLNDNYERMIEEAWTIEEFVDTFFKEAYNEEIR